MKEIKEKKGGGESHDNFVFRVIDSIFDYKDNKNATIYLPNLGRFD